MPFFEDKFHLGEIEGSVSDSKGESSHIYIQLTLFTNRIMLTMSNTGTFGSIVLSQKDPVSLRGGTATYETQLLLGNRSDIVPEILARRIVEEIDKKGYKLPLLLCFGVAAKDRGELKELVDKLVTRVMTASVWEEWKKSEL